MDLIQSGCNPISQNFTTQLASSAFLDSAFYESHYLVEVVFPYGKFGTRLFDGTKNFIPVKDLQTTVTLDHQSKVVF